MKEVVRKEVLKWLDAEVIYPISDSSWMTPIQVVPKKGGTTMVKNENNELLPTRIVIGWRICIDYRKLNKVTRKDHFPLSFIDQMLDRLVGNEYFVFWMDIQVRIRFLLPQKIKKIPLSPVLMSPSPLGGCHLAFAMHPEHSKDV